MAKINHGRMTAKIDGDFVVFIIGAKIHKPWKLHKWVWVAKSMLDMVKELKKNPDSGFLGVENGMAFNVQYWRSMDHLTNYARTKDALHFPAWVRFNKGIRDNDAIGVFHETYLIKAGQYEADYTNVPAFGLGKFSELIPAVGRYGSARSRAGLVDRDDAPVTPEGEVVG